jgi:MFS family permease
LSPAARTFILYGLLYDVVLNLYKPFGPTFLQRVGGDAAEIFFLNYMPALFSACILIPALLVVKAMRDSGRAGLFFLCLSRFFLLSAAFVPFLPGTVRPWAYIIVISLIVMPEVASQSALQAYLGQAFSEKERASALSKRLAFGQVVVALAVLASGAVLRFLPGAGVPVLAVYQCIFAFSFCLSIGEMSAFKRLIRLGGPQRLDAPVGPALGRMVRDRRFMAFAGGVLVFYFGWQMGWPLFSVWQVKYLGADEGWLAVYALIGAGVQFASYIVWRGIIERRGLAFSLAMSTLGQAINPVVIALCDSAFLQAPCQLYTGFFTAGIVVCFMAGFLGASPDSGERIVYAAVYNTAINLCQVFSQQTGLFIYKATDIRTAIVIDAAVRCVGAGAFVFLWIRGRKGRRIGS